MIMNNMDEIDRLLAQFPLYAEFWCNRDTDSSPTADAVIALQIAVGSREYNFDMNVNDDGVITSLDALMILQAAVESNEAE